MGFKNYVEYEIGLLMFSYEGTKEKDQLRR